jgi:hypothetical protein
MLASSREARAFAKATQHVAESQADVLAAIVRQNSRTEFGRAHDFGGIDGSRAYRQRVPLSRYEDYAAALDRIAANEQGVLTRDRVELLEPTSGTTDGEKLIPYTASLRRQFQRAIAAWIVDLFRHRPALRHGRAYWSISPAFGARRQTTGGIPIGFDNDTDYLGNAGRWLVGRALAVPANVSQLADIEEFRYRTLWHLLRTSDLTLISVWSPTFLSTLLAPIEAWHDRLCFELEECGDVRRATELRGIFRASDTLPEKMRRIWPRLALISCWADAGSARYLGQLRELFPTVEFQPKGLLATEGCVSFPLLDRPAAVLAVRSHFFEFQETDAADRVRLAHELDRGGRYRVVLTTAGGLYRYQLGDEIEVVGFEHQCPLLRFLGRAEGGCDLVGEKLAERHVRTVVDRLMESRGLAPLFTLLVPVDDRPPRYCWYLQSHGLEANATAAALAETLDAGLAENPHYAHARRLGQLAPPEVVVLEPDGESAWQLYQRACLARGMRLGNIKPMAMDASPGWPAVFARLRTLRPDSSATPTATRNL